jgi:hypothetical protein
MLQKGLRDGQGTGKFKTDSHSGGYTGSWKDAKPDGQGRWETSAFTYTGGFKAGLRHGSGELVKAKFKYTGDWKDDMKHGYGTAVYPDGTRYEGEWDKDLRFGYGVCQYPDGETYTGSWKENWRWGEGTSIHKNGSKYVGSWYKDMRQGNGSLFVALNQKVYEGGWWRNKRHGKGTYFYLQTGEKYVGDWFFGKEDGEGEIWFADGSHYQGSWVGGNREGIGVLEYANGDKYIGEWVGGKREGPNGAYIFRDYGKFIGTFKNDRIDGSGNYHTFAGRVVSGDWTFQTIEDEHGKYTGLTLAGKRWGRGTQVYPNGDKYDGEWKIGVRSGYGILDLADGSKYVGFWISDRYSRFGTFTWKNGQKFVGRWARGSKNGPGTMIFSNGDVVETDWIENEIVDSLGVLRCANGEVYHGPMRGGKPHGVGQLSIPVQASATPASVPTSFPELTPAPVQAAPAGAKNPMLRSSSIQAAHDTLLAVQESSNNVGRDLDKLRLRPGGNTMTGFPSTKNAIVITRRWDDGVLVDGLGSATYPNGDKYSGYFAGKKRHGIGRLVTKRGSFTGHWKDDREDGLAEWKSVEGDSFVGYFRDGQRDGVGVERNPEGGGAYFGIWKAGKLHGCCLFQWPDGIYMFREYYMGQFIASTHFPPLHSSPAAANERVSFLFHREDSG